MGCINMNVKKYMFGVCCRINRENFVKRDEHDPLKRYKRDEKMKPYYEPVEWMDMIYLFDLRRLSTAKLVDEFRFEDLIVVAYIYLGEEY